VLPSPLRNEGAGPPLVDIAGAAGIGLGAARLLGGIVEADVPPRVNGLPAFGAALGGLLRVKSEAAVPGKGFWEAAGAALEEFAAVEGKDNVGLPVIAVLEAGPAIPRLKGDLVPTDAASLLCVANTGGNLGASKV